MPVPRNGGIIPGKEEIEMDKMFEMPEVQVIAFNAVDVIVTSGEDDECPREIIGG